MLLAHSIAEVEVVLEAEWAQVLVVCILAKYNTVELVSYGQVLLKASISNLANEAV